jgi:ribonuclease BN (tRNA processing enzyme)
VAVTPAGSQQPTLLLDAGTGIRAVGALLGEAPFRGTILLTHLHWDHVQGLPFFGPGDREDAHVRLLLPDEGVEATDMLRRAMSPPHFPIGPEGLRGTWRFDVLDEGTHDIEGITVRAGEIPHKGGRTFGYRLDEGGQTVAYVPDHLPAGSGPAWESAVDLVRGVDVLVHDAQFVDAERDLAHAFGHCTIDEAIQLAVAGGCGQLVLFHHSPSRTDDEIDGIQNACASEPLPVVAALEGDELAL